MVSLCTLNNVVSFRLQNVGGHSYGHFSGRLTAAVPKGCGVIFIVTDMLKGHFSGRLTAAVPKGCGVIFITILIFTHAFSGRLTAAVLKMLRVIFTGEFLIRIRI